MGKSSTNGDDGIRRNGQPKRSERRWWKKDYSGDYQPPAEYFENLEIGLVKILSYKLMSFVVSLLNSIIESGS